METQAPQSMASAPSWEPVAFVSNYYDTPLEGVANLHGLPHVFFFHDEVSRPATVQEQEEWGDEFVFERIYSLYPVNGQILEEMQEEHAIFERWHEAWMTKRAGMEHHPALPEDRERYDRLKSKLGVWKDEVRKEMTPVVMIGDFAGGRREVPQGHSRWQSFEVMWSLPNTMNV